MIKSIELVLPPEQAADGSEHRKLLSKVSGIPEGNILHYRLRRRSVDARSKSPKVVLLYDIFTDPSDSFPAPEERHLQNISNAAPVAIIGCGPAGLFAALRLIELGFKPIIIERGKNVKERRRDLAILHRQLEVNPDSNYCFGEGGAGTYSDGKLYTRSDKRGNIKRILETLILHGASPEIAIDTHPHIGTNKLPGIIASIRKTITDCGGEIHFNLRMTEIVKNNGAVTGILVQGTPSSPSMLVPVRGVILATGHSARDVYESLFKSGIYIESKAFALGVRIEHPQSLIDHIQYHCDSRGPYLPAASYALSAQSLGRGVYSFCMCPGGIIAAAATAPGEIVVNGWSPSKRNNPFANSGMVVSVDDEDFKPYESHGPLKAMYFQSSVEQRAFEVSGGSLRAPAQRLMDFLNKKHSSTLPKCSYFPGIVSADMDTVLPEKVILSLRDGLMQFGKKMKGYLTNEAVLVATESRTSSPVRIPRSKDTLMHPDTAGLFPCGEGAGYAGGIMSAAMDGERCADAAAVFMAVQH